MSPKPSWNCSIGGLALLIISAWQGRAGAQITVGYRNPIGVSSNRTLSERQAKKETRLFELAGINAIPIDGSLIYTEDTIFKILDQNKSFSLNVADTTEIKTFENKTRVESASAGRTENVFVIVAASAARVIPQPFGDQIRSNAFLDPTPNLSVFGP
jgi:hypothetical protein